MYDFESVSVSSFEAASLAATLSEKSADGWDVVAIVPAGSDVIAYLRRATATETDADTDAAEDALTAAAAGVTDGTSNTLESSTSTPDSAAELLTPTSASSSPTDSSADITTPTATSPTSAASSDTGGTGWGATHRHDSHLDGWLVGRLGVHDILVVGRLGAAGQHPGHTGRARRLVCRPRRALRTALLGRHGVDRARVAVRPAVHRSAGRLIPRCGA